MRFLLTIIFAGVILLQGCKDSGCIYCGSGSDFVVIQDESSQIDNELYDDTEYFDNDGDIIQNSAICNEDAYSKKEEYNNCATEKDENLTSNSDKLISAGNFHTCFIKEGSIFCWGKDENYPNEPKKVGKCNDWKAISSGDYHTCAIKIDGRLFCWGDSLNDQLGNGGPSKTPILVDDRKWISVSAGDTYTCALNEDEKIYCWGSNNSAELGRKESIEPKCPGQISSEMKWKIVATSKWEFSAGRTCAINKNNELFCWGRDNGMLTDDEENLTVVNPKKIGTSVDWDEVSLGQSSICSKKIDGRLFCWGAERIGGSFNLVSSATEIEAQSKWDLVELSHFNSYGIREDGTLVRWCYSGTDVYNSEYEDFEPNSHCYSLYPKTFSEYNDWETISAGWYHSCGIRAGGKLYCWGKNSEISFKAGGDNEYEEPVLIDDF